MIAVSLSCIIFLLLALLLYFIDEIFFLIGNNTLMEWVHVSLKPINILDDLLFFFTIHREFYKQNIMISYLKAV